MTVIYVSPTEPTALKDIGLVSMISEEHGADVYWQVGEQDHGVQRKEFPGDFLSSVFDGRLGEQLDKMDVLDIKYLILEGNPFWTNEGKLMHTRWGWTISQHTKLLASIQARGVQIHHTRHIPDTVERVEDLVEWSKKPAHNSLNRRASPSKDKWGRRNNHLWRRHFIQGLPDIGPVQAEAIMSALGFPFQLTVTREDLMGVPGIGKKRAEKISRVFQSEAGTVLSAAELDRIEGE